MKFLENKILELRPQFNKGGKYEKFHTVFDGFATFLFTPDEVTHNGTHIKGSVDLKRTMFFVIIAMIPAMLFGIFNVGHQHFLSLGQFTNPLDGLIDKLIYGSIQVLPVVVVAYAAGLGVEFFIASKKGHAINEGYLVSGLLIPLVLPPSIPLWMVAIASIFAVVFAKEVFGGTGMNVLNVALTARVFLFFAYPTYMSGDLVWIAEKADAYSGATALANSIAGDPGFSVSDLFLGLVPGSIGETSKLAILLGALFLIVTGVGSWKIMAGVFIGAGVMGLINNALAVNEFMQVPFYYHWLMGGLAFGAVFMATDPVSASHTEKGKWIYGILIGVLAVLIRVFNPAYPEGIMLAILFMNIFAPLIDHFVVKQNIKRRLARATV